MTLRRVVGQAISEKQTEFLLKNLLKTELCSQAKKKNWFKVHILLGCEMGKIHGLGICA
jgi:hypothetical protein